MKFLHMADCHIGAWRDERMKILATEAFSLAIGDAIKEDVDFVIIAGDLFNTALPGIDNLKTTVKELKRLDEKDIPAYIIPGSHDFSPSGKTMIDVLEEAGLAINVNKGSVKDGRLLLKFTQDRKTGAKITGILGKKGMLEQKYYEMLDKEALESEGGFRIFVFHTSISELKPENLDHMESFSVEFMPKGFDYYAGGHIHIANRYNKKEFRNVVYPGPVFPANFYELEKLKCGRYCIYDNGLVKEKEIRTREVISISVNAAGKNPSGIESDVRKAIPDDLAGRIVLIRICGRLASGKTTSIDFNSIIKEIYRRKAYFVMKNTAKLFSEELEEIRMAETSIEDIENAVIKENVGSIKTGFSAKEQEIAKMLMNTLSCSRKEDESAVEFQEKIKKEGMKILDIGDRRE